MLVIAVTVIAGSCCLKKDEFFFKFTMPFVANSIMAVDISPQGPCWELGTLGTLGTTAARGSQGPRVLLAIVGTQEN